MTKIKDIMRDLSNLDPEMDVKNYSIDIVEEECSDCLDYKVIGQAYGIISKVAFLIASEKYEDVLDAYAEEDENILGILENTILDLDDEVLDEDNYQSLINFIYSCTGRHYEIDIPDDEDEVLDAPGIDIEEDGDDLVITIPMDKWNEAAKKVAEESNYSKDFEDSVKSIVAEIGKVLDGAINED